MPQSQLFQKSNGVIGGESASSFSNGERKDTPTFGDIEPPQRRGTPPIFASANLFSFRAGFETPDLFSTGAEQE